MALERIKKFELKNSGGFVVRMTVIYGGNESFDENGNMVYFPSGHCDPNTSYFSAGFSDTIDLSKISKITHGARVQLQVYVGLGSTATAVESFIYDKNSTTTKKYKITGATLNNTLTLVE